MAERIRKHIVRLSPEQRLELDAVARSQATPAGRVLRARILLLSDADHPEGRRPDWQIAELVHRSEKQVKRIRHQFVTAGLEPTLTRKLRSDAGRRKVLDGEAEARLVTLCCSAPPDGRQRWTLQLLVEEACRLKIVTTVCVETVRQCLKKTACSPGGPNDSAFPRRTTPASSPRWKSSSTPTRNRTTTPIR